MNLDVGTVEQWGVGGSIGQIIAAFGQILAIGVAIWAILASARSARESKIADVVMHCANRYDELSKAYADMSGLSKQDSHDALKHYYRRFWGLKNDQYNYWIRGMLDHSTFNDWSYGLTAKFVDDLRYRHENQFVAPSMTLIGSWEAQNNNGEHIGGSNPTFETLMDGLHDVARKFYDDKDDDHLARAVLNALKAHVDLMRNRRRRKWCAEFGLVYGEKVTAMDSRARRLKRRGRR